jgi:hypothetical protein
VPVELACAKCGAPMAPAQDWCLQCGAGAPGSIGTSSWRSAATVLGATAILALGAAAAAYAALSKGTHKAPKATTTVAQTASPSATTPVTPAFTTPKALLTPKAIRPALPHGAVKPPKIPLTAATPEASTTNTTTSPTTTSTSTTSTPSSSSTGQASPTTESQPAVILLDTNAASTYNPYSYPASWFGDPSLAIDGDASTAWTAQVNPATAPKMAEGILIDLKARQKLSSVGLLTSTPGMTVQIFGANGQTVPASITAPAWVALSRSRVVRKKHAHITLRHSTKAFTFVALWISKAPASSLGTPEAPGTVSVNELELFPAE